jgi:hypothetical protein
MKVRRAMKEVSPMQDTKIYLLAEYERYVACAAVRV